MKLVKKPWFIPILLTIVILMVGNIYTNRILSKEEPLPEQEIRTQLETLYGGKVENLTQKGLLYEADIARDGGSYRAEVDATTGKVLSLIQTKETSPLPTETVKKPVTEPDGERPAEVKEVPSDKPVADQKGTSGNAPPSSTKPKAETPPKAEKKTVLISEKQAGQIALNQLKRGTIAEVDDIDYEKSTDGGYYLVKIDIDTNADLDEVTYQIHAISGKIMSVTWDD
ncbi:PepSY domain-containing protein [Sporosarcina sp. 179-K 3D1 HS]|uniref:PepSY domain-containing protein n=1 Tax=Sporosarcina sp. 179-K 3D1 HS TaxID=3232169 RepID=UPI00399F9675